MKSTIKQRSWELELIWRGGVTVGTTSPPCMMTRPFKETSSGMPFVADTCSWQSHNMKANQTKVCCVWIVSHIITKKDSDQLTYLSSASPATKLSCVFFFFFYFNASCFQDQNSSVHSAPPPRGPRQRPNMSPSSMKKETERIAKIFAAHFDETN